MLPNYVTFIVSRQNTRYSSVNPVLHNHLKHSGFGNGKAFIFQIDAGFYSQR